jgi:hypothetical protein
VELFQVLQQPPIESWLRYKKDAMAMVQSFCESVLSYLCNKPGKYDFPLSCGCSDWVAQGRLLCVRFMCRREGGLECQKPDSKRPERRRKSRKWSNLHGKGRIGGKSCCIVMRYANLSVRRASSGAALFLRANLCICDPKHSCSIHEPCFSAHARIPLSHEPYRRRQVLFGT